MDHEMHKPMPTVTNQANQSFQIDVVAVSEYQELATVWEASVRATHHFLKEEDIQFFKPLLLQKYLNAVELACVRDQQNRIAGFVGIADGKVEMLFIDPAYRGKGVGKKLLRYVVDERKAHQVDVNEQNEQALGFYEHLGFRVTGRSEVDGAGKPYPILHLELEIPS
jgi:putative acetyltransferase